MSEISATAINGSRTLPAPKVAVQLLLALATDATRLLPGTSLDRHARLHCTVEYKCGTVVDVQISPNGRVERVEMLVEREPTTYGALNEMFPKLGEEGEFGPDGRVFVGFPRRRFTAVATIVALMGVGDCTLTYSFVPLTTKCGANGSLVRVPWPVRRVRGGTFNVFPADYSVLVTAPHGGFMLPPHLFCADGLEALGALKCADVVG